MVSFRGILEGYHRETRGIKKRSDVYKAAQSVGQLVTGPADIVLGVLEIGAAAVATAGIVTTLPYHAYKGNTIEKLATTTAFASLGAATIADGVAETVTALPKAAYHMGAAATGNEPSRNVTEKVAKTEAAVAKNLIKNLFVPDEKEGIFGLGGGYGKDGDNLFSAGKKAAKFLAKKVTDSALFADVCDYTSNTFEALIDYKAKNGGDAKGTDFSHRQKAMGVVAETLVIAPVVTIAGAGCIAASGLATAGIIATLPYHVYKGNTIEKLASTTALAVDGAAMILGSAGVVATAPVRLAYHAGKAITGNQDSSYSGINDFYGFTVDTGKSLGQNIFNQKDEGMFGLGGGYGTKGKNILEKGSEVIGRFTGQVVVEGKSRAISDPENFKHTDSGVAGFRIG